MRIDWAMGCEEADHDDEGRLTLHGLGADTSPVEDFPCPGAWLQVVVCMNAAYEEHIAGAAHTLRWEIHDPGGDFLYGHGLNIELAERSAWHHEGWEGYLVLPIRLGDFLAPSAGAYAVTFRLDEGEAYRLPHYFARLDDLF